MHTVEIRDADPEYLKKIADMAAQTLRAGGVIVYPTDTVYGLGANALDIPAIHKIYQLKKRAPQKPLSVAVKNIEAAGRFAVISPLAERFLAKIWPGPVTVILPKRSALPDILTGGGPIGIRCIRQPFLDALFERIDFPITATSGNVSGQGSVSGIVALKEQMRDLDFLPDLVIDAGTLPPSDVSTVVDLTGKEPKILRAGAMNPKKLLEILESAAGSI